MTWARPSLVELRQKREEEKNRNMRGLLTSMPRRSGTYSGSTSGVPVVKENASQHSGYMAAVRDLGYCMLCRRACRPVFCHRDQTKGMGIKTDVREGWPGCAECHWTVGTSGTLTKLERRRVELDLGRRTRNAILAAGLWPKRLGQWKEPRSER